MTSEGDSCIYKERTHSHRSRKLFKLSLISQIILYIFWRFAIKIWTFLSKRLAFWDISTKWHSKLTSETIVESTESFYRNLFGRACQV